MSEPVTEEHTPLPELRSYDGDMLSSDELSEVWPVLSREERADGFSLLPPSDGEDFFLALKAHDQSQLLADLKPSRRRMWIRLLPPDDAADLLQAAPDETRAALIALLDEPTRREVTALMAYSEDDAGGLMSPRFARVRPDMSIDEAISYLRKQARARLETIYYAYVLDSEQHLLGVVSFRDLFAARPDKTIREVMKTELITIPDHMDQEAVSRIFSKHTLVALPVCDQAGCMKGIVTVDDIVEVVEEEATEDIQKLGGMEALDAPYLEVSLWNLLRKRAGWLSILFVGEMLTASVMSYFEHAISQAVVLALFIPLIISSGGNSGSQATTLIIRAMALGEVRLRDVVRVLRRELLAGIGLGLILGSLGFLRITLWQATFHLYGEHWIRVAATVGISLVGVVMWGTLAGSMLPFALRRLGFDPASASAPFVATLVDVSGLVIYFMVASVILAGTLL